MLKHRKTVFPKFLGFSMAVLLTASALCGFRSREQAAGAADPASSSAAQTVSVRLNPDCGKKTKEETETLFRNLYKEYCAEAVKDPERIRETALQSYTMKYVSEGEQIRYGIIRFQGYEMKYGFQRIGEPDANGNYPLYIALHGGGDADPETNDEQWEDMFYYYSDSVDDGIYVNVRGISDTWNLHFMEESYPMYDRLIEDMILFHHADPNRVYLMGFSAGGDGVYQVSARMADRFAASNMSSGHPNGISLLNLSDLPILLQAGVRDNTFDRNTITVESGRQLDNNASKYGFGYHHQVYIHVPEGHNYNDCDWTEGARQTVLSDPYAFADAMKRNSALRETVNDPDCAYSLEEADNIRTLQAVNNAGLTTAEVDSNAVHWVSGFTRNPFPEKLVWDLDTRAAKRTVSTFYCLKAPAETKGVLTASCNKEENRITVDASGAEGDFSILLNPLMLDFSRPVTLCIDGRTFTVDAAPSEKIIRASLAETSDLYLACAAEISYRELLAAAGSQTAGK